MIKETISKLTKYVPGKNSPGAVKLSSNENPYGASHKVKETVQQFTDFNFYPDGGATDLIKALAQHLGVGEAQLLLGAGGDEVIQIISRAILTPGSNMIQATPTFPQYEHHAIMEGAETRSIPLINGIHDLAGMLGAIDSQTKIIWVCNPNNPTGTYVSESALTDFLKQIPSTVLVVVDEAYAEYAHAANYPTTLPLLETFPNLMVLRTFSKIYGLASFRVGYCVGDPAIVEALNVSRLPFNTGRLAQEAALFALSDQDFIRECAQKNREGIELYEEFFREHQIAFYPSQANFVFIPTVHSAQISRLLMEAGYMVRAFPSGVRITVGRAADNLGVMAVLAECLELLR